MFNVILVTDIIKQHLVPLLVLRRLTPVRPRRRSAVVLIEPAQWLQCGPPSHFVFVMLSAGGAPRILRLAGGTVQQ